MTTDIYTAKIGIHDPDELNVTRQSGNTVFAPSWEMVNAYKRGEISQNTYTEKYWVLMVESMIEHPKEWNALAERNRIVLTCYCRSGTFCHRVLLAQLLEEVRQIGVYKGEL